MNEKLYRVDQFYPGDFAQILTGVYKFEDRGISIKKGMVQDATFIESDPGKHRKKKPPVPVDPESAEMSL